MHNYLFDVKLFASLRVEANTPEEAIAKIKAVIDCNTANLGAWPNGEPILCEVSLDDDAPDLIEIDWEAA